MSAPLLVFRDVIDNDGFPALPDFMTDRCLDLQLAARLETEIDLVEYGAGDPPFFGYAGDRGEPHPGCSAYHFKDRGHRLYAVHSFDVGSRILRHCLLRGHKTTEYSDRIATVGLWAKCVVRPPPDRTKNQACARTDSRVGEGR